MLEAKDRFQMRWTVRKSTRIKRIVLVYKCIIGSAEALPILCVRYIR